MSQTRGRGAHLAWPGTAKGHAPGEPWDRTRTPRGAVTDGLCRVVVRACREEGTTRQEARRGRGGKKNTNKTPQRHRRARSAEQAGGGLAGWSKRAEERPRVAREKKRPKQLRRVTRWGKRTSNGGRGGQEEGTNTGPEGRTPPKRKGTGRERTVLVARTGPRLDADPVGPRQRVAGGPVG